MKILVVGSLNVDYLIRLGDMPVRGETISAREMQKLPGGKGANQAYAAAKLGGDVVILGSIGNDEDSLMLRDSLNDVGVDTSYLNICDGPGGLALVMVNDDGDNSIVVVPGANALTNTAYIKKMHAVIETADIVLLQLEIPLETVVYVAKLARTYGKFVILDPAPAIPNLPDELLSSVDLIKPNEIELHMIAGGHDESVEMEEAIGRLHEKGIPHVLVTLGERGSYLHSADGSSHLEPAIAVQAVDTTAAGDSFAAAFALSIAEGKSFAEAQARASKVASIVVTRFGAQPSIPLRSEIDG